MSFSIQFGNFLYKRAYWLYQPLYGIFKRRQDAFEIELLKNHIRKNDIVLDIGANIGFYASILASLVGENGKVHCFEPDQVNFKHLKKTTVQNKNILINNKAVGPKTEAIKIYTSKNLNVDHRTYKPEVYDEEIEIAAVSVDDYIYQQQNGGRVDCIKMDIQGFEMEAVKGMERTLKENGAIKIISEFWPYGLGKAGSSVTAYYDFLIQCGFTVYLLKQHTLEKLDPEKVRSLSELGEEKYFNILALRENV